MTRLWWVRHAPTHARDMAGHRDIPADLSDTAALARLAAFLPPGAPVTSSDLRRATATADAIAQGRPRLPPDAGFREFDHGAWDGLHWTAIAEGWPDLSRDYWTTPGDAAPPGGESWNAGAARVSAAADRHLGPPDVIIVAHMGAILTQLARATGQTPAQTLAQPIAPLSVTCLRHDGTRWHADLVNHLA
jgi:broad specificity phosphatase PhoE